MSTMAFQITSVSIVYLTLCSGPDQRKHQSSASLAFVRGIHRWPVNSLHKWPVTRKLFPFYDVIIRYICDLAWIICTSSRCAYYYLTEKNTESERPSISQPCHHQRGEPMTSLWQHSTHPVMMRLSLWNCSKNVHMAAYLINHVT